MRVFIVAALIASFVATDLLAAETINPAKPPIAPGKPAGVKTAQDASVLSSWLPPVVLLSGIGILIMSTQKNKAATTAT